MEAKELETEGNTIESKTDDAIKIAVSKDIERKLSQLLGRVNKGFDAGRILRRDLADWILRKATDEFSDTDVRAIRSHYFDISDALSTVLKRTQGSIEVSSELRALLMAELGYDAATKKNNKK